MQRQMLKSKIHRATITDCDPDYVGSVTVDPELMASADLIPNEQVHVWDIDNGGRFVTYVIEGKPGSGDMQVNGAAARLVASGQKVIVASKSLNLTFGLLTPDSIVKPGPGTSTLISSLFK